MVPDWRLGGENNLRILMVGNRWPGGRVVLREVESEESCRQNHGPTNRNRILGRSILPRRPISSKPDNQKKSVCRARKISYEIFCTFHNAIGINPKARWVSPPESCRSPGAGRTTAHCILMESREWATRGTGKRRIRGRVALPLA